MNALQLFAWMSEDAMVNLFIKIVVVGLIFWLFWWLISFIGIPEPFNKVLRVVLALFAVLYLVSLLLKLT